jgi:mannosyltransferase OCH1-like enzyme
MIVILLIFLLVVIILFSKLKTVDKFTNIEKIPKTIYKIYIDDSMEIPQLPDNITESINTWKNLNPGYIIKLFSGNDCRKYLKENFDDIYLQTFDCFKPYAFKADFFRYCIIYNEGGWYSDLKQVLYKPLSTILRPNSYFICSWETDYEDKKKYMQNSFFGAEKKCPILKTAIDYCISNCKQKYYGDTSLYITGPYVLAKSFKENVDVNLTNEQLMLDGITLGSFSFLQGEYFIFNNEILIKKKCDTCGFSQDWKNGNNYLEMFKNKDVYSF